MLTIQNYVRAGSLEEAYALCQKKNNVVLGGMLWLKMQRNRVDTAIDLSGLGLDQIEETDSEYRLGAMVTLRQLELHPGLDRLTQGAMAQSVRHIVGVQFRNCATVGGSVFGRFGFSDVLTLLLALEARVVLYHGGEQSLADFAAAPRQRDILTHIVAAGFSELCHPGCDLGRVAGHSVVGMLLQHEEGCAIVHSTNTWLLQHDLYSWETACNGLVFTEARTRSSRFIDSTLKAWLTQMNPEDRGKLVDGVYTALSASGAVTVADLNRPKTAVSVLREMKKLDEPTKAIIQQAVELLSASARENLPVVLERMRKEKE